MRERGLQLQQILLGAALLAALVWNLAYAADIKGLHIDTGATGTRAEVELDREADYKVISLANPDRLVIDLPGSAARHLNLPPAAGLVKAVRSGQPVSGTTRIVFDLASPVVALKPRFEKSAGGTRLVVEWPGDNGGDPAVRTAVIAANPGAAVSIAAAPSGDVAPATVVPSAPDPAVASAAATSRLIAAVARPLPPPSVAATAQQAAMQRAATTPSQVSVPQVPANPASTPSEAAPSQVASAPIRDSAALPQSTVGMAAMRPPGTTVATGIPTRIATGVPATAAPSAPSQPAEDDTRATVKALQSMRRGGMRPLVIAIDPGHGGQDPGAIGLGGKREKDVTLAIGRELARQINASPGLKAYMTRDTDVFIPLNRRAQLARAAKADIFVSIHADAAENRSANGSSVYVLSTKGASSQRARWLADKENSADLIGGRMPASDNTLASVLLDLTQSGHMKASEDAAGHVLSGLANVGNNHKPHIERANFAVLRTSDMPSMLVETAFISNPEEERLLSDPGHQRTLARAVLGGIDTYFLQQPPPGTLYAARADAGTTAAVSSGVGSTGSNAAR